MYTAGIIGRTGAGDYGHGLDVVYRGMPEVKVLAVADPDEKGRAECAVRTGAAAQFADYRQMLEKARPQIVSVCPRWIDCHREMVLHCIAAGVKAIYCEKPFARSLAEADEMLAAAAKANVPIAVAHQNRAVPYLTHVRDLIAQGAIGALRRIRGKGKDDARGGAQDLVVLGTHVLDMMRFLAGDPQWAWSHVKMNERDLAAGDIRAAAEELGPLGGNNLTGYYAFPGGVSGSYESYVTRGETRHMGLWIEGTAGTITLHGSFRKQAYLCRRAQWTPDLGAAAWEKLRLPDWDANPDGHPRSEAELLTMANQAMIRGLIACIEKGGRHFSSGEDARWAMEMYLAVPHSQRTGERVPLPMQDRRNPWAVLAGG